LHGAIGTASDVAMLIGQGSYDNVRGERVRGIALISSGMR
jgi:hypothetical protein